MTRAISTEAIVALKDMMSHINDLHRIVACENLETDSEKMIGGENEDQRVCMEVIPTERPFISVFALGQKSWYQNIKFSWHWSWNQSDQKFAAWSSYSKYERCDNC